MTESKIKKIKLSELIPDPQNANKGTERGRYMLEHSISSLGAGRSVLVDKNNVLIAGNKTTEVAVESGFENAIIIDTDGTELIVVRRNDLDLATDEKAKQLAIADNRVGQINLNFDTEVLLELDKEIDLSGFFTDDELNSLSLDDEEEDSSNGSSDNDDIPETEKIESRVSPGDIWKLGRHFICCGDCTVEENVRKLLSFVGGRSPDIVWADIPYGMNLDADFSSMKSNLKFAHQKKAFGGRQYQDVEGDDGTFNPLPLFGIVKEVEEQFWWGADYYAEKLPNKNDGAWLVWDKRLDESADQMFGSCFELCWSKKKHKRDILRVKWAGIFGIEKEDTSKRVHPNQKPYELHRLIFEKYSSNKSLIFDPCLGSGSSLISAQKMEGDRIVCGFELSENYCETIIRRWESISDIPPIRVGSVAQEAPPSIAEIPEGLGF